MAPIQRTSAALLSLVVVALTGQSCPAKPTREQIIALSAKCKSERKRMDLVAEFGVDFAGLDLSGVDLRGLHYVGFATNLRGADLTNCNLTRAEFGSANLDGADLTGANLEGATFVTASLKRAVLVRVNFKGTTFRESDLSGAKLAGADLSSANISGSNFSDADLTAAVLSGARNEYGGTFRRADLTRAKLAGLRLKGVSFQDAVLRSADLSAADLGQADFTGADLSEASFTGANVESAVFRDVQGLSEAQRADLEGQSQRWKFELRTNVGALLRVLYFPAYALLLVVLVGLSWVVLRSSDRPRSVVVALCVNVLTFLPAFFLFIMALSGTSSTVQFNVGRSTAMELWSAWTQLWPLMMAGLVVCLAVAVVTALVFLAAHWRWSELTRRKLPLAYVTLTVVHCLFAAYWVLSASPRA